MTWRAAMQQALYGSAGFFTAGTGPAAHFRTSAHVGHVFATAVVRLIHELDAALGRPPRLDVVDVGAGRGELLTSVRDVMAEDVDSGLIRRVAFTAVELAPRPPDLDPTIAWQATPPNDIVGLALANEWLDNVPLDVVEVAADGVRIVEVDESTGHERLGPLADDEVSHWLTQWWPTSGATVGDRAECGFARDVAWADLTAHLDRGLTLAIDYGHTRSQRVGGAHVGGTLAAYRGGHPVRPVPDGSCDLTAHVAMDACAAAGISAGATVTVLATQREALHSLGVSGQRPPRGLADEAPAAYLAALAAASDAGELLDPAGLGSFLWLVQAKGVAMPEPLLSLGGTVAG